MVACQRYAWHVWAKINAAAQLRGVDLKRLRKQVLGGCDDEQGGVKGERWEEKPAGWVGQLSKQAE
jgi:hypothetical protein